MNDIYQAPDANLTTQSVPGEQGSVETAILGEYEFQIGTTLSEAWSLTKGAKWQFHLAFLFYTLFYLGILALAVGLISTLGLMPEETAEMGGILRFAAAANHPLSTLITTIAPISVVVGIFMLAIRRAAGQSFSATSIFNYFGQTLKLAITAILMYIFIIIGFLLLVIPGIYLTVAYYMAMPLVIEKNMGPWEALETSRKAISKRWFAVFGLVFCLVFINLVGIIPLGIGLIWTLPMSVIAFGILYRNMFGCEDAQ